MIGEAETLYRKAIKYTHVKCGLIISGPRARLALALLAGSDSLFRLSSSPAALRPLILASTLSKACIKSKSKLYQINKNKIIIRHMLKSPELSLTLIE